MASKLVDSYLVYQLVSRLITPFPKWEAFKLGIIDKDGNVIKHRKDLTPQEQNSWGFFDILVANVKKMIAKLPGGKTRIANFAAAAYLMREQKKHQDIDALVEGCQQYLLSLNENMGVASVAGLGVGPQGEPPGRQALLTKARLMLRRRWNVGT
jgi:hypothetical protein